MQKIDNVSWWIFSRSFRHNLTSWYASFRRAWYYLATMRVFQERCKLGSEIRRRSRLNSILIVETPLCSEYPRFGSHILAGVSYTSHKLGARFDRELLFNLALVAGTTFPQMIYRFRFSFFQRLNNLLPFHSYSRIRFIIFFQINMLWADIFNQLETWKPIKFRRSRIFALFQNDTTMTSTFSSERQCILIEQYSPWWSVDVRLTRDLTCNPVSRCK